MESLAFDASKDIHHSEMTKGAAAKGFASWWKSQREPAYICFDIFSSPLIQTDDKKIDW